MNKTGFTLVELLVVVLIIGILAAMALPNYQTAVDKARFMQAMADIDAIKKAEELYFLANGEYTKKLENLDIDLKYVSWDATRYKSADERCAVEMKNVNAIGGKTTADMAANLFVWCYLKKPYAGNSYGERIGAFVFMDRAMMGTEENPQPIPAQGRRLCTTFEGKNITDRAERVCKSYSPEKIRPVPGITSGYAM